jgi:hypothetical protein
MAPVLAAGGIVLSGLQAVHARVLGDIMWLVAAAA